MTSRSRLFRLTAVFLTIPLLCACVRGVPIEKMGLIVAVGYDYLPNHKIMGTTTLYQIDPNAKEKVTVLSNTAYTSKGSRNKMNQESSVTLVSGQLRVALYDEKLARQGILNLVDTLARDKDIGSGVYINIAKGRALGILSHRYPEIGNIGTFLYNQNEQNITGEQIISSTLHDFLHDYYAPGQDPAVPCVTRVDNEVHLDEIALFQGDRMVTKIPSRSSFFLKLLRGRFHAGMIELAVDLDGLEAQQKRKGESKHTHSVIDNISSKTKIRLKGQNPPRFHIQVDMYARLQEITSEIELSKPEQVKKLEVQLAKSITNEIENLIRTIQKYNVDPAGFGQKYKASVRGSNLTKDKWRKMFPKAQFQTDVKLTLVRTGVTD
ncbi:Ger(x)C family spore germination protein [Brevibacillus dissolubilis]|uniref:Ger(x)C family spore germination protein n=1 Tax=Brevibacillus dissolubilis TaxID=1844116 RepID=UPI0011170E26|nr:Ger(x)C family spore germination protein [Brevibacillus dissolubilis]